MLRTASLGSNFNGSYGKKECKELSFWMFLTQAASCEFVWEFQTFVSMNIWLNAFTCVNYLMINSLWNSKNMNKSFVFKTRPDIGEHLKELKIISRNPREKRFENSFKSYRKYWWFL